jgi:AcrR family transcriptional regulator
MPPESSTSVKYFTPLRQAQRDLTRSRIRDAARDLFYEQHYETTTMDEIAVAAGLRRSTVYLHYKDKAEILSDIIADYTPKARSLLATLPGPKPTRQQLQRWIMDVARFVAKERVPLSIILELRRMNRAHANTLEHVTSQLLAGLGENNLLFRKAAREDGDPVLRARGLLLLRELMYACELYHDMNKTFGNALLRVTVDDFHAFLSKEKA